MGPTPLVLLQATDILAFAMALAGAILGGLWLRDREPGFGWFALGLLLSATFYATDAQHLPTTAYSPATLWYVVVCIGMGCLVAGLAQYLDLPARVRRLMLLGMLVPVLLFMALSVAALFGVQVPRGLSKLVLGAIFGVAGLVTLAAARREPGAGHGAIAATLFGMALLTVILVMRDARDPSLRYWAPLPVLALTLTMMTTALRRRRRLLEMEVQRRRLIESELTALNASLEATVAERTEELQRLVDGLESFNRTVSHDLRGALGGIAQASRLALRQLQAGDNRFAHQALPLIAQQAEDLQKQMTGLLALARTSEITLRLEPIDVGALAAEIVEQLRQQQGEARPLPRIDIAADMPSVLADPELLRPALLNLIANAVKFTRDVPSPHVQIGAQPIEGGVEVFVRDNGPGFEPAAAARLFSPFVRLHGAQYEGHGVGLSIVRRAIERHGGRVWAEGETGRGAVFRFCLPELPQVSPGTMAPAGT